MAVSTIDALYNGGSEKVTATSTGISVTGTVTADGLGVSGLVTLDDYSGNSGRGRINIGNSGQQYIEGYDSGNAGSGSYLSFGQGASERLRIDNAGSVGIGCTPASAVSLDVQNLSASSNNVFLRIKNTTNQEDSGLIIEGQNGGAREYKIGVNAIANSPDLTFSGPTGYRYYVGGTERMRIDSNGSVDIGGFATTGTVDGVQINGDGSGIQSKAASTGFSYHNRFYNSNNQVGYISTANSSTQYNTSSDYRLKTDAQPMTGASARVQALNPVNFEWIVDGTRVDGFLAHEAQAVVPECVTGTKDAMRDEEYEVTAAVYEDVVIEAVLDDEGNELEAERTEQNLVTEAVMGTRNVPDYQGIDQSKLVPLLTAALQEALTEIAALKARVTTLEG